MLSSPPPWILDVMLSVVVASSSVASLRTGTPEAELVSGRGDDSVAKETMAFYCIRQNDWNLLLEC